MRGKDKCKILKSIRKAIAEANDIALVVEECKFRGECRGTCPRCEYELRVLERELRKRRIMGLPVKVAGIVGGVLAASSLGTVAAPMHNADVGHEVQGDTVVIKGVVVDNESGETLCGAYISDAQLKTSAMTDVDGVFSISTLAGNEIKVSYIGYDEAKVVVNGNSDIRIGLTRNMENVTTGIIVTGYDKLSPVGNEAGVIKGRIVDEENEPLIGVAVGHVNAKEWVATDYEGEFEIAAAPDDELRVSYVGYHDKYIKAGELLANPVVIMGSYTQLLGEVTYSDLKDPGRSVKLKVYGPDGKRLKHEDIDVTMVTSSKSGQDIFTVMDSQDARNKDFKLNWSSLYWDIDDDSVILEAVLEIRSEDCKPKRITVTRPSKKSTVEVRLEKE